MREFLEPSPLLKNLKTKNCQKVPVFKSSKIFKILYAFFLMGVTDLQASIFSNIFKNWKECDEWEIFWKLKNFGKKIVLYTGYKNTGHLLFPK